MNVMEIMGPDLAKLIAAANANLKRVPYVYNVQGYGALGNGINDDTSAIQAAVNDCIANGGGVVVIPRTSTYYKVTGFINATLTDGMSLVVMGDGYPELRFTPSTFSGNYVAMFNFLSVSDTPVNVNVRVEGVKFNGIGVPEQWTVTDFNSLKTIIGLDIKATYAYVNDCQFDNLYGYGLRIKNYRKAIVNSCHFEKVGGHWYTTDGYDSFGDSVYFAFAQDKYAIATASNCRMIGYPSDRPRLSRIAVTFEFGAGNGYIENCYMEGYDRGVHVEAAYDMKLDIEDVTIERYDVGIFVHGGAKSVTVKSGKFFDNQGSYAGTSGPVGTYSITNAPDFFQFNNCIFDLAADCESFIDSLTYFYNCEFKSNTGRWTMKSVLVQNFTDCVFIGKAVYFYLSQVEKFIGCKFLGKTGTGQTEVLRFEGGFAKKFADCRFVNAFTGLANCIDFNFEFDSCRFEKDGTLTLTDDAGNAVTGFIFNFNTTIIIRDCIQVVNAAFPFDYYGGTGTRYLGTNNKVVNNVWSSYP
ncbi:right-handed parallel beta-helix repeat-containing protein [Paenibacillus rigui]|uniref:Uncharacterized protein n=1 Tax=Paenibacillus rigui TaxID=554312 RepID=A0A229UKY2_9BACL|nr:right-handed parallel beta-helix repeat-containing protein [Paenibacillus rigui]OXM83964.1 hypothetical protein CF651_22895 [Paenibacillus rigui]